MMGREYISLACQTVCEKVAKKWSGHYCSHSAATAEMLAEPIMHFMTNIINHILCVVDGA